MHWRRNIEQQRLAAGSFNPPRLLGSAPLTFRNETLAKLPHQEVPSRFTSTIGMTSVGASLKRIGRALIASTTLVYQSGRSSGRLVLAVPGDRTVEGVAPTHLVT
jgi:hypothetical protein